VNVVRVRARCVGVGLVYRAPVAAATKAARAGGYAVLARRTVPGDALYQREGRGRKKLMLPRRDRLFRSSPSVLRCVRVCTIVVCVYDFFHPVACVTIAAR